MSDGRADEKTPFVWKRAEDQAAWTWIAAAFAVFYFGEAVLFWRGIEIAAPLMANIPLANPLVYPLGYWGLFGLCVYLVQRKYQSAATGSKARFRWWQGTLLTAAITIGVVGTAFVVIRGSGSQT